MVKLADGTPEEAGFDPGRIATLRDRASEWCDGNRMRTGVLLAARRGKIVFHEAYGPLTWQEDAGAIGKDAIFTVASMTKPVTATLAMLLVEDGLLGLNRPVKEYLPEICGEGADDIEVQHLLTHTSGYEDEAAEAAYEAALRETLEDQTTLSQHHYQDTEIYLNSLWDLPALWVPGSEMAYSDHNFILLGEIICRISGGSLDDFARQRLFDPLGMIDTSYVPRSDRLGRVVVRSAASMSIEAEWGAHGLRTTALDMARFGQMFLDKGRCEGGRILSPASVREMTRNQIPGIGAKFFGTLHPEASWGLGWSIQADERWMWETGSLVPKGTCSHSGAGGHSIWVDPVNEVVGVYLSVCLDIDMEKMEQHWHYDLFQNMVTAAALD